MTTFVPGRAFLVLVAVVLAGASGGCGERAPDEGDAMQTRETPGDTTRRATFGAGCFWCVEAVFQELEGVLEVTPGYAGGTVENPSYDDVCAGMTGHAEVAQIRYDPARVGYADLLEVFWKTHDPTTLNRQGADVGTQYRSVVFFHDEEQARLARALKRDLDEAGAFGAPIVTEIVPLERFHPAETYHHDYYARNPDRGYCQAVIRPKVEAFRQVFADRRKARR